MFLGTFSNDNQYIGIPSKLISITQVFPLRTTTDGTTSQYHSSPFLKAKANQTHDNNLVLNNSQDTQKHFQAP